MSNKKIYDFAIIGGGLYGTRLTQLIKMKYPSSKILLIEKKKRHEIATQSNNFIPLETGYNYPSDSKKFKFVRAGNIEIEELCKEHNLDVYKAEKLILAKHPIEKERIKFFLAQNKNSDATPLKISFEKAKEIEPLLDKNKLEQTDVYHLGTVSLVDEMAIKNLLCNNMTRIISENKSSVDCLFNTHVKEIAQKSNEIEIKSIGLKDHNPVTHWTKYLINASGYSALDLAHKIGLMSEFSSTKILFNYYMDKLPENSKFPNAILSTPAFKLNPGIKLYIDNKDNSKLGPIYKMNDKLLDNTSMLSRFRNVYEWTRIYQVLHSGEREGYDPSIEYMYNQKVKVIQMFKDLCSFDSHSLNSQNTIEIKQISSIVYSNKLKKIEEDFVFAQSKNSIHLVNFNVFGKFSSFLPACQEVCNLIK